MSDSRHIRRQIRRSWEEQPAEPVSPQAAVLAGLNIAQVLEANAPHYLHDFLHYGPNTFAGNNWAAVLIWFRRQGYHTYQELTLFGAWTVTVDRADELLVGVRYLKYSAPVFNPESYQHIIRRSFQTYYGDDGHPPQAPDIFFRTPYDPARRLALRQELADALVQGLRRVRL